MVRSPRKSDTRGATRKPRDRDAASNSSQLSKPQASKRTAQSPVDQSEDPHAQREAERYVRPIASRELIMQTLEPHPDGRSFSELREALQLSEAADQEALRRRLRAMTRDQQVKLGKRGRYVYIDPDPDPDPDPNHEPEEPAPLPVARRNAESVEVVVVDKRAAGPRAEQELPTGPIVGVIWEDAGFWYVQPDRTQLNQDIQIQGDVKAKSGDYVLVQLEPGSDPRSRLVGHLLQVLGPPEQAGVEREVILHAHRIPREFPDAVLDDTARLPAQPLASDFEHRVDLRDVALVTIDGEDARDFDDAVYAERRKSGGFRLLVAIADVGHYVLPGTALDREAQLRGNSVYFPDLVIPMLPEALSNGLCSLRPREERLCMVCDMTISQAGRVSSFVFYEGVMRSAARLTYNQVAAALDLGVVNAKRKQDAISRLSSEVMERLTVLRDVYLVLREQRETRGALDFRPTETAIIFNAKRRIERIEPRERNDAHKLIEECMVAANVCAGRAISGQKLECVYRVHEPPAWDRWTELCEFLATLGIRMPNRDELPNPLDLQAVLASSAKRPGGHVVETVVLRSLMQANYAVKNQGHFGLALPIYTHFTSPIRRYADLLVHRALRYLIRKSSDSAQFSREKGAKRLAREHVYPYNPESLQAIGEHISNTERRADAATRDLEEWLKCDYMNDHLGGTFDATVASVTSFGLFVEVDDLYVQGLMHISTLGGDYYRYDAKRMELRGERNGARFRLGTRVRVKLSRVDVYRRQLDFVPEGYEERRPSRKSRRARG